LVSGLPLHYPYDQLRGWLSRPQELIDQGCAKVDELPADLLAHGDKFLIVGDAKGGSWGDMKYELYPDDGILHKYEYKKRPLDDDKTPAALRARALTPMALHPPAPGYGPGYDSLRKDDVITIRQVDRLLGELEVQTLHNLKVRKCLPNGKAELVPLPLKGGGTRSLKLELSWPGGAQSVDLKHPLLIDADAIGESDDEIDPPIKIMRWWRDDSKLCLIQLKQNIPKNMTQSQMCAAISDEVDEAARMISQPGIAPAATVTQPHRAPLPGAMMAGGTGDIVARMDQLEAKNRQLEAQVANYRDALRQLESELASIREEGKRQKLGLGHAGASSDSLLFFDVLTTSAALPPTSQPPSYPGNTVYAQSTAFGYIEGPPRAKDAASPPTLLQAATPDVGADLITSFENMNVEPQPATNAKNQLQEWCMRLAKRYPLPDYVSACDKHYWRCTVTVRDLEGELVLAQQGPSAATQKDAQMAAAEQAMRVILASEAGSCDNAREASAPAPAAHLTTHMGAKNQLQEWCVSASRRYRLPDYGECRPTTGGWECTVQIFDLEGQLVLRASATAATKRDAQTAAAEKALSSIS